MGKEPSDASGESQPLARNERAGRASAPLAQSSKEAERDDAAVASRVVGTLAGVLLAGTPAGMMAAGAGGVLALLLGGIVTRFLRRHDAFVEAYVDCDDAASAEAEFEARKEDPRVQDATVDAFRRTASAVDDAAVPVLARMLRAWVRGELTDARFHRRFGELLMELDAESFEELSDMVRAADERRCNEECSHVVITITPMSAAADGLREPFNLDPGYGGVGVGFFENATRHDVIRLLRRHMISSNEGHEHNAFLPLTTLDLMVRFLRTSHRDPPAR